MKFLIDVCAASRSMYSMLTELGHDVVSASERMPRATDAELMAFANKDRRVLITEDKDFGELVFARRLPHPCIVRFVEMRVEEKVAAMRELIERHPDELTRSTLIVVTRNRVRIRSVERENRHNT